MQSFRIYVAGVAVLATSLLGCGQQNGQCPRPIGEFHGTYALVAGTCTQLNARDLKFSDDGRLVFQFRTNTLADAVTTDINLIGCTIGLKQLITDPTGVVAYSSLEGELNVHDETALSGQLAYMEYMPDGQTERCRSQVEANYTVMGSGNTATTTGPLGAAAQRALSMP